MSDPILNRHLTASISNNNANILDVMNGDQRFDVSLDGTFLFHTTNLNAFFNSCYEFVKSEHHKREKKNFQLPFLTFAMLKFLLLKVPNENRVWKWASSFSACLHSLFFSVHFLYKLCHENNIVWFQIWESRHLLVCTL